VEDEEDAALRLVALGHRLRLHALRLVHADVAPLLLAVLGGQAGQIRLDERLELVLVDVAHEDEGEVAGVGEALLVDGERLVEVDLVDELGRHRLAAQVVLRHQHLHVLEEDLLGAETAVAHLLDLTLAPRLEHRLILAGAMNSR
jgi:hypothetical protein